MGVGHAEAIGGLPFEVHFDEDRRFVSDDIAVMARFDRHDLRRDELERRPVAVVDMNPPARDEADVRVHAQLGAHRALHVRGPPEPRLVDHALDAAAAGARDVHAHAVEFPGLGPLDRRQQWIGRGHQRLSLIGIGSLPSAPAVSVMNSGSCRIDAKTASTRASIISLLRTESYLSYSKK